MSSLSKGVHIETAEKIARGFSAVNTEIPALVPAEVAVPIHQETTEVNDLHIPPIQNSESPHKTPNNPPSPSDGLIVSPSDGLIVSPSDGLIVSPSDGLIVSPYQTSHQTPLQYVPLEGLNLAYNQACVLKNLISNSRGITNYRTVSEQTHIGIPSVREALSRLVVKGFMHKPVTVKNASFQGFSYILNKALCDRFLAAGGLSQDHYNGYQTIRRSDGLTLTPSDRLIEHSSSESLKDLKSTTTTTHYQTVRPSDSGNLKPSDDFILIGAIGAYWEGEGLGEGQAQKWCSQFKTEPQQMRQQLEWARYDLETNGKRSAVKKDTISWFFGYLRTTGGCFPRPINYKSPIETLAETIEKDLLQEREARIRLVAAETEQKFQQILADPAGNDYQNLYAQVSKLAKEVGGDILVHALRDVFQSRMG
jgi:hypothetical protein